jgi:hypothetical protein
MEPTGRSTTDMTRLITLTHADNARLSALHDADKAEVASMTPAELKAAWNILAGMKFALTISTDFQRARDARTIQFMQARLRREFGLRVKRGDVLALASDGRVVA